MNLEQAGVLYFGHPDLAEELDLVEEPDFARGSGTAEDFGSDHRFVMAVVLARVELAGDYQELGMALGFVPDFELVVDFA